MRSRFTICLAVCVLLVVFRATGVAGFFEKRVLLLTRPVIAYGQEGTERLKNLWNTYTSLRSIAGENTNLSRRVMELEQQLAEFYRLQDEAERLRLQQNFAKKPPATLVPCTVIGRDPSGEVQAVVLDCGQAQGVEEGLPLVFAGQVVGKVLTVSSQRSTALLLSHPDAAFDATVGPDKIPAVVRGSFGSGVRAEIVDVDAEILPGEIAVTAGLDPKVVSGLLLGSVSATAEEKSGSNRIFALVTSSDLRRVDYVFVVKP